MRTLFARSWTIALLILFTGTLTCLSVPSAQAAFGVKVWEAGTCKEESCSDSGSHSAFYTQAAGHPNFGITLFEFNNKEVGIAKAKEPEGHVKDVRVDLPPGLAVNPEATKQCTEELLDATPEECPKESQVGEDDAVGTVTLNEVLGGIAKLPEGTKVSSEEKFSVFNMVRKAGEAARFGVAIESGTLSLLGINERSYLEGGISWYHEAPAPGGESSEVATGDYHEFFEIKELPQAPELVSSKLVFWGVPQEHTEGTPTAFITMPSTCSGPQTTKLHVDSYEDPGHFLYYANETPVGASGCESLEFKPTLLLTPDSTQSDAPDGLEATLHVPQYTEDTSRPNSPTLKSAEVTLPEGMTLNPSAANGLEACTNAEIGIGTNGITNAPIACPASSIIGVATIEAPGVPNGSLKGSVYLGTQESQEPESGKEFRVFLAAEAAQYGVGVRLEGNIKANALTGQLTALFTGNPQIPFENLMLKLNGGVAAPLANPLQCGAAHAAGLLAPYSGEPAASISSSPFTVDADGKGGACLSPLSFALTQTTHLAPETAGAYSAFTFGLSRPEGQQYLSSVQATLPPGLLAAIPSITLCTEAQASAGTCTSASEIGTVTATAGSGEKPYSFTGHVYLTGPYNGAPYGLAMTIPAVAGPFNLGTLITRATINVNPYTARLIVNASVPKIFGGVPLRLRTISVAVNRNSYLFNPTNCGIFATETLLNGYTPGSTTVATQSLSTPFQVAGCGSLAFKPAFSASTAAHPTRANGASLTVKITQPAHQANIKSVTAQLPMKLPSRLTTLQKACKAATFEASPSSCSKESQVGTVTVVTPVLPEKLKGIAYFVSHGNEAFPNLDLVLQGNGVTVILVGDTNISKAGITTSSFATLPDVPVSSVELNLPTGPYSALTNNGSFCPNGLTMPTTIVAQNNATIKQSTKVTVNGCPITIVSHKVSGKYVALTVRVPEAGRVSGSGSGLKTVYHKYGKAEQIKFKVNLTSKGLAKVRKDGRLKVRVRVGFVPTSKAPVSKAFVTVTLKS